MIEPFVIGSLALFAAGRALVLGAACAGGDGITREDEPMLYWLVVLSSFAVAAVLFYFGLSS